MTPSSIAKTILMAFVVLLPGIAQGTIYRWVNKQGVTVFSDQKPPKGIPEKKITVSPTMTAPQISTAPTPTKRWPLKKNSPSFMLQILSPHNKEGIRANNGDITIKLKAKPDIPAKGYIILYMDNQQIYKGTQSDIPLTNVFRGRHRIHAVLYNFQGAVLGQSKVVTFYVLRHSILFHHPHIVKP